MARSKQENDEEGAEEGILVLAGGAGVLFQPTNPDGAAALQAFGSGPSVQLVYCRFFGFLPGLPIEAELSLDLL